jgi:hypothetical protein
VVTPDLRKRAAPVVAQGVSFVAVLVIALIAASPSSGHVAPRGVRSPTSPSPTSPAPAAPGLEMVVLATANGQPLPRDRVVVLADRTLGRVSSGALNAVGIFTADLPVGSYQVCVSVPADLEVAGGSASGLPGWACSALQVKAGAATSLVKFSLRKA